MLTLSFVVLLLGSAFGSIYVDPLDSPYEDGLLDIDASIINPNLNPVNPAPMHSKVYYPTNLTESFMFGVFYYIPGFFGIVPPALYDDLLTSVAAHGYVAISTWPVSNGDGVGSGNYSAEAHIENVNWLQDNLPRNIRDLADFDYIGLGCHSAGCAPTLGMARIDTQPYLVTVNLEPVSVTIIGGADFTGLPSLHMGAEIANGSCSIPNFDFERFYTEFHCPKVLLEAANAGHCDLLTDVGRAACVPLACDGSDDTDLALYRQFVQGLTAAYLNTHVQGNDAMLDFVTDPTKIPYPLKQYREELDC